MTKQELKNIISNNLDEAKQIIEELTNIEANFKAGAVFLARFGGLRDLKLVVCCLDTGDHWALLGCNDNDFEAWNCVKRGATKFVMSREEAIEYLIDNRAVFSEMHPYAKSR